MPNTKKSKIPKAKSSHTRSNSFTSPTQWLPDKENRDPQLTRTRSNSFGSLNDIIKRDEEATKLFRERADSLRKSISMESLPDADADPFIPSTTKSKSFPEANEENSRLNALLLEERQKSQSLTLENQSLRKENFDLKSRFNSAGGRLIAKPGATAFEIDSPYSDSSDSLKYTPSPFTITSEDSKSPKGRDSITPLKLASDFQETNESYEKEISDLQSKHEEELLGYVEIVKQYQQQKEKEIEELKNIISEYELKISQERDENKKGIRELEEEFEFRITAIKESFEKRNILALETLNSDYDRIIESKRKELSDSQGRFYDAEDAFFHKEREYKETIQNLIKENKENSSKTTKEISDLNKLITIYRSYLESGEDEIKLLKKRNEVNEQATKELKDSLNFEKELRTDSDKSNNELFQETQEKEKKLKLLQEVIDNLKKENRSLEEENSLTKGDNQILSDQNQHLSKEHETLVAKVTNYKKIEEELKKNIAALEQIIDENQKDLKETRIERDQAKQSLIEIKYKKSAEILEAEGNISNLEAQLEILTTSNETLESICLGLSRKKNTATIENRKLATKVASLESQLEEAKKSSEERKALLGINDANHTKILDDLSAAQSDLLTQAREKDEAVKELEKANKLIEEQRDQIHDSDESIRRIQDDLDKAIADNNSALREIFIKDDELREAIAAKELAEKEKSFAERAKHAAAAATAAKERERLEEETAKNKALADIAKVESERDAERDLRKDTQKELLSANMDKLSLKTERDTALGDLVAKDADLLNKTRERDEARRKLASKEMEANNLTRDLQKQKALTTAAAKSEKDAKDSQALSNQQISILRSDLDDTKRRYQRLEETIKLQPSSNTTFIEIGKNISKIFNSAKASNMLFGEEPINDMELNYYKKHHNKIHEDKESFQSIKNVNKMSDEEIKTIIQEDRENVIKKSLPKLVKKLTGESCEEDMMKNLSSSDIAIALSSFASDDFEKWKRDNPNKKIAQSFCGKLEEGSEEQIIRFKAIKNLIQLIEDHGVVFGFDPSKSTKAKGSLRLVDKQETLDPEYNDDDLKKLKDNISLSGKQNTTTRGFRVPNHNVGRSH
jgi:hypothetical protein